MLEHLKPKDEPKEDEPKEDKKPKKTKKEVVE